MPSSPTAVRVETCRTSPLKTSPSGVRTSTSTMCSAAIAQSPRRPQPRPRLPAPAAGELLGDEQRLREEALGLARPRDRLLVLVGELVDAEDGDDVLQLL